MSMAAGGTNDYKSDINITPLVDVVLVLLIIFMVITPLLQMGYDAKAQTNTPIETPADQLVVSLMPNNKLFLNKQELTAQQLATQLADNLKNRSQKTVFFSADDTVVYEEVAKAMDLVRNAGATNIGIVLETVQVQ